MLLRITKNVLFIQSRNLTKKPKGLLNKLITPGKLNGPPYTHFVQIGDPVLQEKAEDVPIEEITSDQVQDVIHSMIYALERFDGVGISAPQIGVPLRIIAMQFTKSQLSSWTEEVQENRKMEIIPLQIFINPTISVLDNSQITHREGCCSLHGFSCRITRSSAIKLNAFNENGDAVELEAKNWTARVIQHEVDHLNGLLITDKMEPGSLNMDYWWVVNKRRGDFKLSFDGIKSGPKKWISSLMTKFWKSSN